MRARSGTVWSSIAAAVIATAGLSTAPVEAAEPIGIVVHERVAAGNDVFVYVPGGVDVGYRAASTPILLVLGDGKVDEGRARRLAELSGLASIAKQEQGVVAFLNPAAATWQNSDTAAVTDTLGLYSDSTGAPYDQNGKQCAADPFSGVTRCAYPGSKTRVYVFGDRAGADFINQNLVPGLRSSSPFPRFDGQPVIQTWTPTAVWIANATKAVVPPSVPVEVPAFVVNAGAQIRRDYAALNRGHGLFAATTTHTAVAFDRRSLLAGYGQVVGHAIQRTSEVNAYLQGYRIPDYRAEGIEVTHTSYSVGGAPLEYFQYLPRTARRDRVPLVLVFHGGGNHAEYQMWATGWPELAKRYGFLVVSVNRHVDRSPADVIGLLDHLIARYPNIDVSRVYASGFSMGSVKTWALGEEFTSRFAAIAPMSGSFAPGAAAAGLLPTIYFGGEWSPLPEFPHQKYVTFAYSGQSNNIDDRLRLLFERNNIKSDYVYDSTQDERWGISPTSAYSVQDREFPDVSVTVNDYASRDGQVYTALGSVKHGSHEPLGVEAQVAWRFMSHFSRAANGDVVSDGRVP